MDIIEISDDEDEVIIIDSDGSIEIIEEKSANENFPWSDKNDESASRPSSTDREVKPLDLDKVRLVSSDDDTDEDDAIVLRCPNPMIPGKKIF